MVISDPKKFMEYTGAAFEPKDTKPWLCRNCARTFKHSMDLERKKIIAKVFYNM